MAEKPDFEMTVTKTYRSHAEVEGEKQRRAAEATAREQRLADAMATIAALNAEADQAAAEEENDAIDSLGDLDDEETTVLEFTEEDFARIENDDANDSADEYAPKAKSQSKSTVVAKSKKSKPKKGETRAEVEELTKALKAKGVGGKKKSVQNSDAAAASKRAGLSETFLATSAQASTSPGKFEYGGLTEEDAESTRPDLDIAAAPAKRINELVVVVSSDAESDDDTPIRAPAPVSRPVPRPRFAAPKVKFEPRIPALPIASETPMPKKSKKKVKLEAESSQAGFFTPDTAADVKGLPALVAPTWDSHMLPAMYHDLACSLDPISFTACGDSAASRDAAVQAVRKVVNEVHPGNTLPKLVWGDRICSRIVSRVRERRSLMVQAGVNVVDAFFQTKEYIGNPVAIREYARYAIRGNGPAFWKEPTPLSSPRNAKAPGYIPPDGYMESPMILGAASDFLKTAEFTIPEANTDGSFDSSELPTGLFGLIAAGVERGLKRYVATGVRQEELPKFTKAVGGPRVAAYITNIRRFTRTRWISLLTAARPTAIAPPASDKFEDEFDGLTEYAYVPSSP
ncbi:hypothetical protein C8F04DRAFT_1241431 [Mycena alexandri]|uniref:Uncharacterized protein n=1 Tax=Mycena alexandri TaxID=1745969 RepID=A0AAD6S6T4_9AGAR|nr:hypothetical protein C8F04DRAFT_1241431 [Mycena alexandri]